MIDLLRRLLIGKPSETAAKEPEVVESRVEGEGPLFGLHPPEGTYFKVILDDFDWAVVHIRDASTNKSLALGLEGIGSKRTVEEAIKIATNGALKEYNDKVYRKNLRAKYEGNYPPKRTS